MTEINLMDDSIPCEVINNYLKSVDSSTVMEKGEVVENTGEQPDFICDDQNDEEEDQVTPDGSMLDNRIDEMMNSMTVVLERLRTLGNVSVNIDGNLIRVCKEMGIGREQSKKTVQDSEPSIAELVKSLEKKIASLVDNPPLAPVQECGFDEERFREMIDLIDKKLQINYSIGKSYADNLREAIRSVHKIVAIWVVGSMFVCSLAMFVVMKFL